MAFIRRGNPSYPNCVEVDLGISSISYPTTIVPVTRASCSNSSTTCSDKILPNRKDMCVLDGFPRFNEFMKQLCNLPEVYEIYCRCNACTQTEDKKTFLCIQDYVDVHYRPGGARATSQVTGKCKWKGCMPKMDFVANRPWKTHLNHLATHVFDEKNWHKEGIKCVHCTKIHRRFHPYYQHKCKNASRTSPDFAEPLTPSGHFKYPDGLFDLFKNDSEDEDEDIFEGTSCSKIELKKLPSKKKMNVPKKLQKKRKFVEDSDEDGESDAASASPTKKQYQLEKTFPKHVVKYKGNEYALIDEKPLSNGGFGKTSTAYCLPIGCMVVIKRPLNEDKQLTVALEREAKCLKELTKDPDGKKYFPEYILSSSKPCMLVMRFAGLSLANILLQTPGPLEPIVVENYFTKIKAGLNYMHSKGILHLDLKPGNIVRTICGNLQLIDFGSNVQRPVNDSSVLVSGEDQSVTYAYMAPEPVNGEKVSELTDVFSLGIIIFELIFHDTQIIKQFKRERAARRGNFDAFDYVRAHRIEYAIHAYNFKMVLKMIKTNRKERIELDHVESILARARVKLWDKLPK